MATEDENFKMKKGIREFVLEFMFESALIYNSWLI